MKINGDLALQNAFLNKFRKYPSKSDFRYKEGLVFPYIGPKFKFKTPIKVFTIGSCFARHIEEILESFKDIEIPTRKFVVPKEEWPHRPNGLLNEYTPGCIKQRILSAFNYIDFSDKLILEVESNKFIDCLLPAGAPVSFERALKRREEINSIYKELMNADLVIITLGYIESWFDLSTDLFLNRMPDPKHIRKDPKRYQFIRLGVQDTIDLLEEAFSLLKDKKILLTVSPVPIQSTFVPKSDCVLSNSYSKSVLRIASEYFLRNYDNIDYFPSYEIVLSYGNLSFMEDNVHVKDEIVTKVVSYFVENYLE